MQGGSTLDTTPFKGVRGANNTSASDLRKARLESIKYKAGTLNFTPYAFRKLVWCRDKENIEISGFGISSEHDLLLIEDFRLVKQEGSAGFTEMEDEAVAEFMEQMVVDEGIPIDRCLRVWIHTHPGNSARPSQTDWETFGRIFADTDWGIMAILAKGGEEFAILRSAGGPGCAKEIPWGIYQPSEIDFDAWEDEFKELVTKKTTYQRTTVPAATGSSSSWTGVCAGCDDNKSKQVWRCKDCHKAKCQKCMPNMNCLDCLEEKRKAGSAGHSVHCVCSVCKEEKAKGKKKVEDSSPSRLPVVLNGQKNGGGSRSAVDTEPDTGFSHRVNCYLCETEFRCSGDTARHDNNTFKYCMCQTCYMAYRKRMDMQHVAECGLCHDKHDCPGGEDPQHNFLTKAGIDVGIFDPCVCYDCWLHAVESDEDAHAENCRCVECATIPIVPDDEGEFKLVFAEVRKANPEFTEQECEDFARQLYASGKHNYEV